MTPNDSIFQKALGTILHEVLDGPPGQACFVFFPGDKGLFGTLASVEAKTASTAFIPGKASIAAHVEHLIYAMSLLVRWSEGEENPWATSEWTASWKRISVTPAEWDEMRAKLRSLTTKWKEHAAVRRDWNDITAAGALSSAAHTACHLAIIRQLVALGK